MNNYLKIAIALVVVLVIGCASTKPLWVDKGNAAFEKGKSRIFYGVGRASSEVKDPALRTEAADNRARGDLQRIFDTYTSYLMKDYQGQDGQLIERACKTFSAGNISGAQIVDHYSDDSGTVYSLVKLDMDKFKDEVDLSKELNDAAKEYIRQRSDAMFEQLQKEEEKHELYK